MLDRPTDSSRLQNLGHVLDPDPVQLDVLPVGDVGHVPAEGLRDLSDCPQLQAGQLATVQPHSQHEERVLKLLGLEGGGLTTRDAGPALGVQAPPAEAVAQVDGVDGSKPGVGVAGEDALAHVEAVIVALGALVRVERLTMPEGPLALTALARGHWLLLQRLRSSGDARHRLPARSPSSGRRVDGYLRRKDQRQGRQAALATRCRSTCRRATRKRPGRHVVMRTSLTHSPAALLTSARRIGAGAYCRTASLTGEVRDRH